MQGCRDTEIQAQASSSSFQFLAINDQQQAASDQKPEVGHLPDLASPRRFNFDIHDGKAFYQVFAEYFR